MMTALAMPPLPSATIFTSAPPQVHLVQAFTQPYNNAIATARSCYAARLITAEDVCRTPQATAQRDAIAQSTYAAGHHTIWQHATFQFALQNVSRQFIWAFLHAHAHYNSEQVSQRYVTVRPQHVRVPALPPPAAALYCATVQSQMLAYQRLVELLLPSTTAAYFQVFPARRKKAAAYQRAIVKKAQETARYCLPVATHAHLYHTISGITLMRYQRLCHMLDVPQETAEVVGAMVQAVRQHDPLFMQVADDPLPLEQTHEYQVLAALQDSATCNISSDATSFIRAFDAELQGRSSRLLTPHPAAEATLARAVRSVLGLTEAHLSDAAAIERVLSPRYNALLTGHLNLQAHGKLSRTLQHVHYTFAKKLSHSADSQDQRHRTTPGSRPILQQHYAGGSPDVVVPAAIQAVPAALALFQRTMQQTWQAIDQLLDAGVAAEQALYLLPNAFPIRFEQSGDLAAYHHKWTTRLCYNAQVEIWQASLEEVQAVQAVHPRIGAHLQPPCGLRHVGGVRPVCPEGPRFCGVKVWQQALTTYQRTI